jgi:hypothetical protein
MINDEDIHIVSQQFLNQIKTDRESMIMEKCQISSRTILSHIRQKTKDDEKEKSNLVSNHFQENETNINWC